MNVGELLRFAFGVVLFVMAMSLFRSSARVDLGSDLGWRASPAQRRVGSESSSRPGRNPAEWRASGAPIGRARGTNY